MATIPESAPRKLPSWIEGFVELTDGIQSPEIFRRWTAVAIVAGALEQKVWVRAFGGRTLFANIYALLTGGPGVGKTEAIREARNMWDKLPGLHQAPSSVSRASLIDSLVLADRQVLRPMDIPPLHQFHSLACGVTEFGTFLTQYETEFMSTLNDLYDCVRYSERKRSSLKEPLLLPHPQLNIIAGTTPAWLGGALPETAWAEGFTSRLVLVYSGQRVKVDPFDIPVSKEALRDNLTSDLIEIFGMWGQLSWSEDVITAFRLWYMSDCPPVPEHPRLEHYIPRRHIHFIKLMIVFAVSRGSDYVIRMEDYQQAMELLLEAEGAMPDVFRAMRTSADSNVLDEAYSFIHMAYIKEKRPVAQQRIVAFLAQRVPSHSVLKMIEVMERSGMIVVAEMGAGGMHLYRPQGPNTRG